MSENLLRYETSPYLLQHKDNPVHWRAWGPAAFEEARRLNRPILLSVGYSACHWCHVMAHESFENQEIADLMNELFVNIKVDREERPDVDQIYMSGLHALGGRGGWPLTVFLTPDARLFWGGTYFPPTARFGRAGFPDVLRELAKVYREHPDRIASNANQAAVLAARGERRDGTISAGLLDSTADALFKNLDPVNGGLNGAPKFPQASLFEFLWRAGDRLHDKRYEQAVVLVLTKICQGGIFDHVGGGFARYSTDARWHVPHFEKMLYDNAQLIRLLAWAWKATGDPLFERRIDQTVAWLVREMRVDGGAFASSLDADSEGVEGKFYAWTLQQLEEALGTQDAAAATAAYAVTREGNWEHSNVLHRLDSSQLSGSADEASLAPLREKLLKVRSRRVPPARDDKVLADWNGLMIEGLCAAALAFDRKDWLDLARKAYAVIMQRMVEANRVGHSMRLGRVSRPGFSSDAACLIAAALSLFEASAEPRFLVDAKAMEAALDAHHFDADNGYYFTADDSPDLQQRPSGARDDATPNPNATMAHNLVRLGLLTGENHYLDRAERLFKVFGGVATEEPFSHLGLLNAFDFASRAIEVAIIGPIEDGNPLARQAFSERLPNIVVSRASSPESAPRGSPAYGRPMLNDKPTAYVCREGVCSLPVTTPAELHGVILGDRPPI